VLSALIKQAAVARGQEYLAYPQRHLFDKPGIRHMVLETDPYGNFLMAATPQQRAPWQPPAVHQ